MTNQLFSALKYAELFFTDWTEILAYFRGSELQNYFTKILEDDLKAVIKTQYVDQVSQSWNSQTITSCYYFHQCWIWGT